MNPILWLAGTIAVARLVLGETINWEWLKYKLSTPERDAAARVIVEKWSKRPGDFFKGIEEESWQIIIPMLSPEKMALVRGSNFEHSLTACQAFAKYLPEIVNSDPFPKIFRLAVYELLDLIDDLELDILVNFDSTMWMEMDAARSIGNLSISSPGPINSSSLLWESGDSQASSPEIEEKLQDDRKKRIAAIFDAIPKLWMIQDGNIIMRILVSSIPPRLSLLKSHALRALFQNPQKACKLLTLDVLKSLSLAQQSLMTDKCMAAIEGLGAMDLSSLVANFPSNVFARYNGALSRNTIENMSGSQLAAFGISISDSGRICELLELHYFSLSAFERVSTRCLCGYLSQRWEKGLGNRWTRVDPLKLYQIPPEMQENLLNIHPRDFALMPKNILQALFTFGQVCRHLELSFLSPEIMHDMGASCLHMILTRPDVVTTLGRLWIGIPYKTMAEFDNQMIRAIRNVSGSDFLFMKPRVLNLILGSAEALENLPQPTEQILLSAGAGRLLFTSEQFAAIAKVAPNLAGQLLLLNWGLPVDLFAHFEGVAIKKLAYVFPERRKLDWKGLFESLEAREGNFRGIVESMSIRAEQHFCSTIQDFKEYLSLSWLRRNMNSTCILNISFNTADVFVLLEAPELVLDGAIPWEIMVTRYSLQDWSRISADKEFAVKLGKVCQFWSVVGAEKQDVIKAFHPEALKQIDPRCIDGLRNFLSSNPEFVSLLADDAFSFHKAGELPCSLKTLSPEQLTRLSRGRPSSDQNQSISLGEFESLSFAQFKALLKAHWILLPDEAKYLALDSFSKKAEIILGELAVNDDAENTGMLLLLEQNRKALLEGLNLHAAIQQIGQVSLRDPVLENLLSLAEKSDPNNPLLDILNQSDLPRALLIDGTADKYDLSLGDKIKEAEEAFKKLLATFSNVSGFDRLSTFSFFESFATVFSGYYSLFNDGRVMRLLVAQILNDIKRDLVVWKKPTRNDKFVWGISSQVGFIVGFAFGKAVQLGMQLPFILDQGFFSLLASVDDPAIQEYYESAYSKEISIYKLFAKSQGLMKRIDQLRFAKLSMKDTSREALNDHSARFNLFVHRDRGGGEEVKVLHKPCEAELLQAYTTIINEKVYGEFKAFVKEVSRGLSYPLPKLRGESQQSSSTNNYNRLGALLPLALNPRLLDQSGVLGKVQFLGDRKIVSLVKGQFIDASKVVSAFIRALDEKMLGRLLTIWTGASRLFLEQVQLQVYFEYPSSNKRPKKVDLCKIGELKACSNKREKKVATSPRKNYSSLFSKVSQSLLGSDTKVKSELYNQESIWVYSVEIVPSLTRLCIQLQPSQALILSLIEIITTPITIMDKM